MKTIKLNVDGDLDLTNSQMTFITGAEAVKQKLLIGLRTFLGEWFLDTRVGLPWYERILVKSPNQADIAVIFKRAILSCDGVASVKNLVVSMDNKTRKLSVSFTAISVTGDVIPVKDAFVV